MFCSFGWFLRPFPLSWVLFRNFGKNVFLCVCSFLKLYECADRYFLQILILSHTYSFKCCFSLILLPFHLGSSVIWMLDFSSCLWHLFALFFFLFLFFVCGPSCCTSFRQHGNKSNIKDTKYTDKSAQRKQHLWWF